MYSEPCKTSKTELFEEIVSQKSLVASARGYYQ